MSSRLSSSSSTSITSSPLRYPPRITVMAKFAERLLNSSLTRSSSCTIEYYDARRSNSFLTSECGNSPDESDWDGDEEVARLRAAPRITMPPFDDTPFSVRSPLRRYAHILTSSSNPLAGS